MSEQPVDTDRELTLLEAEIRKLEAEYTMYFAGRSRRPPLELRKRVEGLVKRLDRSRISNYGQRFRFATLQSRFSASIDLWDRAMRAREEGRGGPLTQPRSVEPRPPASEDRVVYATVMSNPTAEVEKLHELYDHVAHARRECGQDLVPFQEFAGVIKAQMSALKEKGRSDIAFRVAVKDGKVALTARGRTVKGSGRTTSK